MKTPDSDLDLAETHSTFELSSEIKSLERCHPLVALNALAKARRSAMVGLRLLRDQHEIKSSAARFNQRRRKIQTRLNHASEPSKLFVGFSREKSKGESP